MTHSEIRKQLEDKGIKTTDYIEVLLENPAKPGTGRVVRAEALRVSLDENLNAVIVFKAQMPKGAPRKSKETATAVKAGSGKK